MVSVLKLGTIPHVIMNMLGLLTRSDPLKIQQKPIDLGAKIAEQEWNNDDVEHKNFVVYSCIGHGT